MLVFFWHHWHQAKASPSKYKGAICNLWASVALWKSKYYWIFKIQPWGSPSSNRGSSIYMGFKLTWLWLFEIVMPSWLSWSCAKDDCCCYHSANIVENLKDKSFTWWITYFESVTHRRGSTEWFVLANPIDHPSSSNELSLPLNSKMKAPIDRIRSWDENKNQEKK